MNSIDPDGFALLPQRAFARMCEIMVRSDNLKKHQGKGNWKELSSLAHLARAELHTFAARADEDIDGESAIEHKLHCAIRMLMSVEQELKGK